MAIISCIRFGLCDAHRFTYSARTICESSAKACASVSRFADALLLVVSVWAEAVAGRAGCWAMAVLFPSLAPQAASVRKRRGMLRMSWEDALLEDGAATVRRGDGKLRRTCRFRHTLYSAPHATPRRLRRPGPAARLRRLPASTRLPSGRRISGARRRLHLLGAHRRRGDSRARIAAPPRPLPWPLLRGVHHRRRPLLHGCAHRRPADVPPRPAQRRLGPRLRGHDDHPHRALVRALASERPPARHGRRAGCRAARLGAERAQYDRAARAVPLVRVQGRPAR